jgi:hypothetical protein
LLAAEDQVFDLLLNQRLATAHGEMAALQGALEFGQDRARALRNRGDHWQVVATETPPRLLGKLRRAFT